MREKNNLLALIVHAKIRILGDEYGIDYQS